MKGSVTKKKQHKKQVDNIYNHKKLLYNPNAFIFIQCQFILQSRALNFGLKKIILKTGVETFFCLNIA